MSDDSRTVAQQITDSVTQSSTSVLGVAPAHAMATLYQTAAAAAAMAIQNAVHNQNSQNAISSAVTAQAISLLLTPGPAAQAQAAAQVQAAEAERIAALNQRITELAAALAAGGDSKNQKK